jgi:hypothetical protein
MRRHSWLISAVALAATSVACTALLGDYTVGESAGGDGGGTSGQVGCDATQKTCNDKCVSKEDPVFGCGTATCTACNASTNAAPACKAGICSFACNDGFSDCDGIPANGCEANSATDVANCGACGRVCGQTNANTPTKCAAGKCVFSCKAGFDHCTGPAAVDQGCETDLNKDAANCGACGHSCLGGQCVAGRCQPFELASASFPSGLAVGPTDVYFTFPSVPAIKRVQRDGKCTPAQPCPQDFAGTAVSDPFSKIRGPSAIVANKDFVFWTNQANGNLGRRAAALPPGPIVNFGAATSTEPGYLTFAGGKIYFVNGFANAQPTAHIRKADLDGTNVVDVAFYASPAPNFFGPGQIASDALHVYWASKNSGVFRAALTDAACTEGAPVASGGCLSFGSASSPYGIDVDANFVYWTEPASGTVRRAPKAGGQSVVIAINQDNPRAIAVNGSYVYWGTGAPGGTAGTIRRAVPTVAQCDGIACELVTNVAFPDAIVSADDGIYWTNNTATGGVYRLAK